MYTNEQKIEMAKKAKQWDDLDKKITDCYFDENGAERDDDFADLITIGEIAAYAFGFL